MPVLGSADGHLRRRGLPPTPLESPPSNPVRGIRRVHDRGETLDSRANRTLVALAILIALTFAVAGAIFRRSGISGWFFAATAFGLLAKLLIVQLAGRQRTRATSSSGSNCSVRGCRSRSRRCCAPSGMRPLGIDHFPRPRPADTGIAPPRCDLSAGCFRDIRGETRRKPLLWGTRTNSRGRL